MERPKLKGRKRQPAKRRSLGHTAKVEEKKEGIAVVHGEKQTTFMECNHQRRRLSRTEKGIGRKEEHYGKQMEKSLGYF